MESFLEKLKKGMGIEETIEMDTEVKNTIKEESLKEKKEIEVKKEENKKDRKNKEISEKNENETKEKEIQEKESKKEAEEKKTESAKKVEIEKENKWFAKKEGQLVIDMYETENELVVQTAIAGAKPEEINVVIENDTLSISGKRELKRKDANVKYLYQECFWGNFSREIILPTEVDPSRVKAVMEEGILTIRIPKIDREKRRKIEIKLS
jgi:HSP20 family molecular chaperone IbpA